MERLYKRIVRVKPESGDVRSWFLLHDMATPHK